MRKFRKTFLRKRGSIVEITETFLSDAGGEKP